MRRFTRLTNGFSKKLKNHAYAVALHQMFYNFVRMHQALRVTPAMAAGVTETLWTVADIVGVIDRWEAQQRSIQPVYVIEANRIGEGYFVRITFPDAKAETVYGFKSELDAAKWIRCEAVVWLYERRLTHSRGQSPQGQA